MRYQSLAGDNVPGHVGYVPPTATCCGRMMDVPTQSFAALMASKAMSGIPTAGYDAPPKSYLWSRPSLLGVGRVCTNSSWGKNKAA